MKKISFWQKGRKWIADRVKAFFEYIWDRLGWRFLAIVICAMGIALVILWLVARYR